MEVLRLTKYPLLLDNIVKYTGAFTAALTVTPVLLHAFTTVHANDRITTPINYICWREFSKYLFSFLKQRKIGKEHAICLIK